MLIETGNTIYQKINKKLSPTKEIFPLGYYLEKQLHCRDYNDVYDIATSVDAVSNYLICLTEKLVKKNILDENDIKDLILAAFNADVKIVPDQE